MQELRIKAYYLIKKLNYRYRYSSVLYEARSAFVYRNIQNSFCFVYLDFDNEYAEFLKFAHRRAQAKTQAKKYLTKMFNSAEKLSWVTLTFSEEYINLKESTKKKYILKWCNDNCFDFYGNVDYGKTTQREHFHIVADLRIPYLMWEYGFLNVEPILLNNKSQAKLNTYLHKLVNHSGKLSTGKSFHKRKSKKSLVETYDLSIF